MVINSYIKQQRRALQETIDGFMTTAAKSTGKLALSVGISTLILAGGYQYQANAKEPMSWVGRSAAIAFMVSLGTSAFYFKRARQDWREWSELDSQRSELMGSAFHAQFQAMQQSSLLWAHTMQRRIEWELDQQFPARPMQRQPVTVETQPALAPTIPALPTSFDPAYSLGTDPSSAIIAGVPGSGKGTTAANALAYFKRERPDATVFVIDPKADTKEVGNWAAADVVWSQKIKLMNPEAVKEWVERCLEQFLQHQGPKLLILDEGSAVLATLKQLGKDGMAQFKAFLAHITSMGDSESEYLWLLVQIVHAEDLGFSGGYRSMPRAIAIASPKNRQALNAFLDTKFVPKPGKDDPSIDELMRLSPCGRAVFDGQTARWYPLATLPNVCGYDRDTRSYEPGHQARGKEAMGKVATVQTEAPAIAPRPDGDIDAWWEWLSQQTEGVSVRDVQRKAPRPLRMDGSGKTVGADYVRSLFAYFASVGFGAATDDGGTFRPHF